MRVINELLLASGEKGQFQSDLEEPIVTSQGVQDVYMHNPTDAGVNTSAFLLSRQSMNLKLKQFTG